MAVEKKPLVVFALLGVVGFALAGGLGYWLAVGGSRATQVWIEDGSKTILQKAVAPNEGSELVQVRSEIPGMRVKVGNKGELEKLLEQGRIREESGFYTGTDVGITLKELEVVLVDYPVEHNLEQFFSEMTNKDGEVVVAVNLEGEVLKGTATLRIYIHMDEYRRQEEEYDSDLDAVLSGVVSSVVGQVMVYKSHYLRQQWQQLDKKEQAAYMTQVLAPVREYLSKDKRELPLVVEVQP